MNNTADRTDKHEPTPMEALEYIATAASDLINSKWPASYRSFEDCYRTVTIADIRLAVAEQMAAKKEYFTSDYRHANDGPHNLVCMILGSTVAMNDLIQRTIRSKAVSA